MSDTVGCGDDRCFGLVNCSDCQRIYRAVRDAVKEASAVSQRRHKAAWIGSNTTLRRKVKALRDELVRVRAKAVAK